MFPVPERSSTGDIKIAAWPRQSEPFPCFIHSLHSFTLTDWVKPLPDTAAPVTSSHQELRVLSGDERSEWQRKAGLQVSVLEQPSETGPLAVSGRVR